MVPVSTARWEQYTWTVWRIFICRKWDVGVPFSVRTARGRDFIVPIPRVIHWLPVRWRIVSKTAIIVRICIHVVAFAYLQERRVPVKINVISCGEHIIHQRRKSIQTSITPPAKFCTLRTHPTVWNNLLCATIYSLSLNNSGKLFRTPWTLSGTVVALLRFGHRLQTSRLTY